MPVLQVPIPCPHCGGMFTVLLILPRAGGPAEEVIRLTCRHPSCRQQFDALLSPPLPAGESAAPYEAVVATSS